MGLYCSKPFLVLTLASWVHKQLAFTFPDPVSPSVTRIFLYSFITASKPVSSSRNHHCLEIPCEIQIKVSTHSSLVHPAVFLQIISFKII